MAQQAPGKAHREGISLIELFERFPDDTAAEAWFEERRWGQAGKPSHCPMCGNTEKQRPVASRKPLPYWCGVCRRHYSVKTNSVMHRSRIGLQKWAIAIFLWSTSLKGVSSMKLHRDLNITQKSAYFMAQRLREAWSGKPGSMYGPVEADETYIGGKMKNMHAAKRREARLRPEYGKTIVAGAKDRATNHVSAEVVPDTTRLTLSNFLASHVAPDTLIYTDESKSYSGLPQRESVVHSRGQYVDGDCHTNGIESFWSLFKRSYHGTFHHLSAKHLQRYVDEFTTRHNMREEDTIVMMEKTVAMMEGKRLTYRELISGI